MSPGRASSEAARDRVLSRLESISSGAEGPWTEPRDTRSHLRSRNTRSPDFAAKGTCHVPSPEKIVRGGVPVVSGNCVLCQYLSRVGWGARQRSPRSQYPCPCRRSQYTGGRALCPPVNTTTLNAIIHEAALHPRSMKTDSRGSLFSR